MTKFTEDEERRAGVATASRSKYKGLSLQKSTGRWQAQYCGDGKQWRLGAFTTEEEVGRAERADEEGGVEA